MFRFGITWNFLDKTMDDTLIYIPNDDKLFIYFCRLKLLVEKFVI